MASWQKESRQVQVSASATSAESTRQARLDSVPGLVSEDAIESRREHLRHRILHDLVEATLQKSLSTKVARLLMPVVAPADLPLVFAQILPQSLVLASALYSVAAEDDAECYLPGGLTFHDINELTPVALPVRPFRTPSQLARSI